MSRSTKEKCRTMALAMMKIIDEENLPKKNPEVASDLNYQVTPKMFEMMANLYDEAADRLLGTRSSLVEW